jgi:GNAT superfamily N-acetyltransferase
MSDIQLPNGFAWADDIQLGSPEVYRLSQLSWPRFLLEESDHANPLLKFHISARDFKERFRVYGIRNSNRQLVAFIQAVLVEIDLDEVELPKMGWRFSIADAAKPSKKNAVSLVEVSIGPQFRGHGLAKALIEHAKRIAKLERFSHLIAPVRPTLKSDYPYESIETYCERKTSNGTVYDPWLRIHLDAGGVITNICQDSVLVTASLEKWRAWTGLPFLRHGPNVVPGALNPVAVDLKANVGIYSEPNIWVKYLLN